MVFLSFVQHCFLCCCLWWWGLSPCCPVSFVCVGYQVRRSLYPGGSFACLCVQCALHTPALLYCIVVPFVQHCVCCVFSKRRWRPVQCFTCQRVQSALCSSGRSRESCFLHMQRTRLVSCHSLPRTWPPCHSVSCWELGAPVSGTWRLRRCSQASPCHPPR